MMQSSGKPIVLRPAVLMLISVALWAIYPPASNFLLANQTPLQLGVLLHSMAALCMIALVVALPTPRALARRVLAGLRQREAGLVWPMLASGLLICANHLFLYFALAASDSFDVTAILVFESWPVLFFVFDTLSTGVSRRTLERRDYLFVLVSFFGFATLMAQEIDLVDWILFDSLVLKVALLAAIGGIAMALNVFARRRLLLRIGAGESQATSGFAVALVSELFVRVLAALSFIGVLIASGQSVPSLDQRSVLGAIVVGMVILGLGSALYDLSIYRAKNAAISAMWYLMPIGALLIMAVLQGRLINRYEAVSSVMIVSANLLIGLKYPMRSSFNQLYAFSIVVGAWCVFAPVVPFASYFDLVAVSTIFYALLITYALTRASDNVERRTEAMQAFSDALATARRMAGAAGLSVSVRDYATAVMRRVRGHAHDGDDPNDLRTLGHAFERGSGEAATPAEQTVRASGRRLVALGANRISGGEYVVLALLAGFNIGVTVVFRGEGFVFGCFALIMSSVAAYLLLLVAEKDRALFANEAQQDAYAQARLALLDDADEPDCHDSASRLQPASRAFYGRPQFGASLLVFVMVFSGFAYALGYQQLVPAVHSESNPVGMVLGADRTRQLGIGVPNWPAARIKAEVLKVAIERNFDIRVDLYPQANEAIFESMSRSTGRMDIHPAVWTANLKPLTRRYVDAFHTVNITDHGPTGRQGLCMNAAAVAAGADTDIQRLGESRDVMLFDLDDNGRGDLWVGAKDWASSVIERRRAAGYGYLPAYDVLEFDQNLLVHALRRYRNRQVPFLFFCYQPSYLNAEFDLKLVDEPPADAKAWADIIDNRVREDNLQQGAAWPVSPIRIAYRHSLTETNPSIVRLLDHFEIPADELIEMTGELALDGQDSAAIAKRWVDANADRVVGWILP